MSLRPGEFYGHVTVTAPGRINLTTEVGQQLSPFYHQLATISLAISLSDEVVAVARDDEHITVSISDSSRGILDPADIPDDHSNVVFQAADLLRRRLQLKPETHGVDLYLTKDLPLAGGVGGRAADAAAALMACAALWDLHLSRRDLAQLGTEISTQVPFAILGGAAVGMERGDVLSPILTRASLNLVIVPAFSVYAPREVYANLASLREEGIQPQRECAAIDPELLDALTRGDVETIALLMHNDLQAAAVSLLPELSDVLDIGMQEGALAAMICGAGPTVMFLARNADDATQLASRVEERCGIASIPISAPGSGARIL
ncbi:MULTISPECIES: 4-(cytidine 5'-diphospho)-2-C-methyl-D-erythritol kinase [Auritidibacter]|uniref:4-(cytidine 5'-diphospho)-2-C-methyl-D-erythritol kinase n=1 Tax=Auritidibacter TaxID=1160973 RepID=UPI000D733259|nr:MULTISPECIES: 4-(cytidine 5'-diphospho)-2-C-methyl-D-erythritol kinase [unclassified Auritidibacter]AXR73961.1 4-(cytidine 5'-diphospho)-2-C-methyl-D-erythritol kinase [Auritidibacter sp. NML130574]PXA75943.1 4-(cytidine 5'-diphospho)-2-C-methyl-D-erythritol kinase [Auritidibacter sp. NML100628]PXA80134.1 4-(cytidine 5'-diphospho)-2-C-methyl-D-erythritol kinase [Auritidibacter sp. NML120636]